MQFEILWIILCLFVSIIQIKKELAFLFKLSRLQQDFIQQAHIHHNLDIFPYTSKGEIYYQF